jgi:N-acetylneuraminic acid mutarotase
MKKGFNWRTAFFTPRALFTLICAAACSFASVTLLAFIHPEARPKVFHRPLTFEERVRYQCTIEEVYWRHRIWPKECPDPKPSLESVMSRAQLEKKVAACLRNSHALEQYWDAPITAEQLQTEMDRMAKQTKQPDVLRELFKALDNDPLVIAECLARPALAERTLTSRYAYDQRIHGQLRQRAESDLIAHPGVEQMKHTTGAYSEIHFVRGSEDEHLQRAGNSSELNDGEWDEAVRKLAATFNQSALDTSAFLASIPIGKVSALQEGESQYYATAVIEKGEGRLKVARATWAKPSIDAWRGREEQQMRAEIAAPNAVYTLPSIAEGSGVCFDGTAWASTALNLPTGRERPPAVWTGSEMIVWGGYGGQSVNTGGKYDPTTNTWTSTNLTNAPSPRAFHTAIWTGNEMIVWGGGYYDGFGITPVNTGGRYNPATDSWQTTSTANAPIARSVHTAVWTGSEMIIWAGAIGNFADSVNTGGRYDPTTDTWTTTSTANAPQARSYHSAVWTGSEMIVWGGANNTKFDTGGKYDPSTDTWVPTSTTNAPVGRFLHTAVWTGTEMIVWGGRAVRPFNSDGPSNTGGCYNPNTNSWTTITLTNAPVSRESHTAVWTGTTMIVWGGWNENVTFLNTGGIYNPDTDSWTPTSTGNAPAARSKHSAVWAGKQMIIWGGLPLFNGWLSTLGRYNPATDSWAPDTTPANRNFHTAVWTGSEMIMWGGENGYFDLNSGAKYSPATDSWTPTSTTSAPASRTSHAAVWSGTEMIIWGGFSDSAGALNTGGRYDPATDNWTATNVTDAPGRRSYATGVWTGNEMIVWGGYDDAGNFFDTGGRYTPNTDSWTPTNTINAPAPRGRHTAVWTGTEMIIWGGEIYVPYQTIPLNTGGKYNPATDSWTATSTANAPAGRYVHTAIWTGSEMIVWGGADSDYYDAINLNTGARYNPATDNWKATNMTNAPTARAAHTAVWTGDEMIIWGGGANVYPYFFNAGGRYDPVTDLWSTTSITNNVPTGRHSHAAVWTGAEMIVWGGIDPFGRENNGGRYCPKSDPTSIPASYMISVRAWPPPPFGGGIVGGDGTFAPGSSVTVTATPFSCYTFRDWTESGEVVSTSPSYQFSASWDRVLVANFSQISYNITVNAGIGGTVSGGGTYGCGGGLIVAAIPDSGYEFANWTENGNIVSTSPDYGFPIDANRTLLANFVTAVPGVETPTISPNAGTFKKKVTVKLSCATAGATIYYTTDGSDPTTASNIFNGATGKKKKKAKGIIISGKGQHTVKAMATALGHHNSAIAVASFTIN